MLALEEFPVCEMGYRGMLSWMRRPGRVSRVGVEGSGAYGAGLARYLHAEGIEVLEVPRPERRLRRSVGKSDPIDAEAAARAVLAGTARVAPKLANGCVEAIRVLRVARGGALKAKTAAVNSLRMLLVTAPEPLRARLEGHRSTVRLLNACLGLRADPGRIDDPVQATKLALRSIASRVRSLSAEIRALDTQLAALVTAAAPNTAGTFALGAETAGALLVAVGDNPGRLRSAAAFARLCGVAPIPASSGKTLRHRLHRGGNRDANRALHVAVVVRMRYCPRTRAYVARRTAEGLSKPEIIRCLKRYLAREVFRALRCDYAASGVT